MRVGAAVLVSSVPPGPPWPLACTCLAAPPDGGRAHTHACVSTCPGVCVGRGPVGVVVCGHQPFCPSSCHLPCPALHPPYPPVVFSSPVWMSVNSSGLFAAFPPALPAAAPGSGWLQRASARSHWYPSPGEGPGRRPGERDSPTWFDSVRQDLK